MLREITSVKIDSDSRIPKYQQIVNSIIDDIENGYLEVGQKIPSINEISEEYLLSRDTVEKAFNQLKERKIIISTKGKGCYVAKNLTSSQVKVLFIINKLSSYKLKIYNAFVNNMGANAVVDLNIYHCDYRGLISTLQENVSVYDYFIIMPHFKDKNNNHINSNKEVIDALKKLPEDKLVILDNYLPELGDKVASVYQDFKMDINEALQEGLNSLKNYNKLIFVYPKFAIYPYPSEILQGFRSFCINFGFDFEIIDTIYPDMELQTKDAYIVIEESDLVNLMKQVKDLNYKPGKDIGIITYNDTPLKELLGITVISTDFNVMGETAAYMIQKKKKEVVKNAFHFINRGSI
jgi:DNA-binding transcriptional regulator YhcF (GntR family)